MAAGPRAWRGPGERHIFQPDREGGGGMGATRIWHGVLFGMVATVVAGVVPIAALALNVWPAPEPITAAVFSRLLDIESSSAVARVLAGLWQLMYGAFWGAVLAYVTGPLDAPVLA